MTPARHGMTPNPPSATVIVPTRKGDRAIRDCLCSLYAQDVAEPFDIIAVMDELDPLAGELRAEFPKVNVITCSDHGAGGARNRGIASARGHYLVFTDADCLPRPDWLRRLIDAARQHPGIPVAGWTEPTDPGWVGQASELFERGIPFPRRPLRVPGVWGSNLCVERELLLKTGASFEEDLFGAEDVALTAQLPPGHREALLIPDALVLHTHRFRLVPATRRMRQLGFGSGVVRRRYPATGAFLARYRGLILLLPAARLLMLLKRTLLYAPARLLDYVKLFPLLSWFAMVYAVGFAAGTRMDGKGGATAS